MVKAASDCYLHQMYDIKMKVKRLLDKISRKCYRMMPISESVQNHSLFGQDSCHRKNKNHGQYLENPPSP